jgi:hypothetical protein
MFRPVERFAVNVGATRPRPARSADGALWPGLAMMTTLGILVGLLLPAG